VAMRTPKNSFRGRIAGPPRCWRWRKRQAIQIHGQGEAEAAKSLSVFQQNPGLASFLFRLTALEGSMKDRTTLIFDPSTPPFDLFRGIPHQYGEHQEMNGEEKTRQYDARRSGWPARRSVDTGSQALPKRCEAALASSGL